MEMKWTGSRPFLSLCRSKNLCEHEWTAMLFTSVQSRRGITTFGCEVKIYVPNNLFLKGSSYLPLTPLIYPCVPDVQAPTPWPLNCKDNRTEAPSSSRWCYPARESTARKPREFCYEIHLKLILGYSSLSNPTGINLQVQSEVRLISLAHNICYYLWHFNVVRWPYGGFFIAARIKLECCSQHHG